MKDPPVLSSCDDNETDLWWETLIDWTSCIPHNGAAVLPQQGLHSSDCNGLCQKGFFCPAGSFSSKQKACGGPMYYCPEGSGFPLHVANGYYTSKYPGEYLDVAHPAGWYYSNNIGDGGLSIINHTIAFYYIPNTPEEDQCPPGYFRNTTWDPSLLQGYLPLPTQTIHPCQLCPLGTYKYDMGDDIGLCRPCDEYSSYSTADRQTCACYRLDGGAMDYDVLYFNRTLGLCVNVTHDMVPVDDILLDSVLTRSTQSKCERGFYCQVSLGWMTTRKSHASLAWLPLPLILSSSFTTSRTPRSKLCDLQ